MRYIITLIALISFPECTSADPTTTPSITDPEQRFGWYLKPNLRSTTDILWSCFSTIFICVWACLHMNIPAAEEGETRPFLRKLELMSIGIMVPEYLAWIAITQWFGARATTEMIRSHNSSPKPWTITHSFYANMGGFVVNANRNPASFVPLVNINRGLKGVVPVKAEEIISLYNAGIINFPDISYEELRDKSKADSLGKVVACTQISWLWLKCVVRTIQGLPLTTLEIATLGYVLCAIIAYSFWWYKPLDVMVPTTIPILPGRFTSEIELEARSRITNGSMSAAAGITAVLCWIVALIAFGVIHFLAWNLSFPSSAEKLLWRIGTVLMIFSGLIPTLDHAYFDGRIKEGIRDTAIAFGFACYTISRLYLIVEPFVSLRSAPAGVYLDVSWIDLLQGRKYQG